MKVYLIVQIPGPMHGKRIPITGAAFTIGRDPQCSLEAANPAIAEQHCTLTIREDQVFVRDLESGGGTFVNDKRISGEIRVREADDLKVGPLHFRVSIETGTKKLPVQRVKPREPKLPNRVFLIVQVPGPMYGKKIPIPGAVFTIGRDPKCSLEAVNPAVAERHCAIEIRGDQVFLRDLESPDGTFVNDSRIKGAIQVRDGDHVKVGPLLFCVRIEIVQETVRKRAKKTAKRQPKQPDTNSAAYAAEKLLLEYLRGKRR